jgi:hypothetical protein
MFRIDGHVMLCVCRSWTQAIPRVVVVDPRQESLGDPTQQSVPVRNTFRYSVANTISSPS